MQAMDREKTIKTGGEGSARLLKARQVSERLGVCGSMTYKLIAEGKLTSVRIGKAVRVPEDELERWIAENTTAAH